MSMINIVKMNKLSPNNTTKEVKNWLRIQGYDVPRGKHSRVKIDGKLYTLTVTDYKKDRPDARQYDEDTEGLVTLWLRDGKLYRYNNVTGYEVTREMGNKSYVNADLMGYRFNGEHELNSAVQPDPYTWRMICEEALIQAAQEKNILDYIA